MNLTYPYATIDGYIRDSRNQQPFNKINGTGILEYAGAARVDILTSTVSISYVVCLFHISPIRFHFTSSSQGMILVQRNNWRLRETGPSSRLAAGGRQTASYFPLRQNRHRILGLFVTKGQTVEQNFDVTFWRDFDLKLWNGYCATNRSQSSSPGWRQNRCPRESLEGLVTGLVIIWL